MFDFMTEEENEFLLSFEGSSNHMQILRTVWHKCVTYMCYVCCIHAGGHSLRIQSIAAGINTEIRNTVAFKLITKYVNMKQVSYVANSCLL
jgi:hypothetical protein